MKSSNNTRTSGKRYYREGTSGPAGIANTVGMYASRDKIEKYIRNQGKDPAKEYKKLYEGQLELDFADS